MAGAEPDRSLPPVGPTPTPRPIADKASGRISDVSADLVPDNPWERIAPLLAVRPVRRHRHPGPLPVSDRIALADIVYVLRKGVAWRDVPIPVVGCSEVTAWRRLRHWPEAGVWPRLQEVLLAEPREARVLDMDDAAIDGSHVSALKGGLTSVLRRSIGAGRAASTT